MSNLLTDDALTEVIRGNNRFALDLYVRLKQQPGNLFFSPFSISTALAMTWACARGETAKQMAEALHFALSPQRLHPACGALIRQLNVEGQSGPFQLHVANALWGQAGINFRPDFLKVVEEHYGGGLNQVDFQGDPGGAIQKINAWCEDQTRQKIKELLKPEDLPPDAGVVLTNAIYFKGDWARRFPKQATRDEEFTAGTGEKVLVPMMRQNGSFHYLDYRGSEGFQALEMPYGGEALSMVIFLPEKLDGLAEFERSLTEASLTRRLTELTSQPRQELDEVAMPRFKISYHIMLRGILGAMGMPVAFDKERADFRGLCEQPPHVQPPYMSDVIHEALVDVNEEGTEAAAATAVVMGGMGGMKEPIIFRADHPFVFLIRDNRTESLLFLGRLTNPQLGDR